MWRSRRKQIKTFIGKKGIITVCLKEFPYPPEFFNNPDNLLLIDAAFWFSTSRCYRKELLKETSGTILTEKLCRIEGIAWVHLNWREVQRMGTLVGEIKLLKERRIWRKIEEIVEAIFKAVDQEDMVIKMIEKALGSSQSNQSNVPW